MTEVISHTLLAIVVILLAWDIRELKKKVRLLEAKE